MKRIVASASYARTPHRSPVRSPFSVKTIIITMNRCSSVVARRMLSSMCRNGMSLMWRAKKLKDRKLHAFADQMKISVCFKKRPVF